MIVKDLIDLLKQYEPNKDLVIYSIDVVIS